MLAGGKHLQIADEQHYPWPGKRYVCVGVQNRGSLSLQSNGQMPFLNTRDLEFGVGFLRSNLLEVVGASGNTLDKDAKDGWTPSHQLSHPYPTPTASKSPRRTQTPWKTQYLLR